MNTTDRVCDLTPGTIWSTVPYDHSGQTNGPLVCILQTPQHSNGEDEVAVIMVCSVSREGIGDACAHDLILAEGQYGIPFACMIRTSDVFPTTARYFKQDIGQVPTEILRILRKMATCPEHLMHRAIGCDGVEVTDMDGHAMVQYRDIICGRPLESQFDPRLIRLRCGAHKHIYLSCEARKCSCNGRRRRFNPGILYDSMTHSA